jgi:two-component system OmpR family sensor kinase
VSIRWRLALLYAAATALVLLPVSAVAYALHVRTEYEAIDRPLVDAAEHFRDASLSSPGGTLATTGPDPSVSVRLFDADGRSIGGAGGQDAPPPPLSPPEIIEAHAGPAYSWLLRLIPGGESFSEGSFATTDMPSGSGRVRLYVLAADPGSQLGYIVTWASLDQVDKSARFLALVTAGIVLGGTAGIGVGSFAVAGRVLRPVTTMTQTARAIAASRGFSRRLEEPAREDELGRLARTFNEMLASLEEAYRSQQRFVADAAHELRAPLTAIQGNVELMKRVPNMPAGERAEALASVDSESRRLSRIVGELLTLARADAGQKLVRRPVEFDRVLLEAVTEVRSMLNQHRLEIEDVEPLVVDGDPDRLKQMILNLLDNSIKYTAAGGSILVSLRRIGGEAVLAVRDSGVGIPAEDLPRIFERFYRADPARSRDPGGSGLGLSIVAWIVDQHEGDINVESELGQGTTVTVRLPELGRPAPDPLSDRSRQATRN